MNTAVVGCNQAHQTAIAISLAGEMKGREAFEQCIHMVEEVPCSADPAEGWTKGLEGFDVVGK
jgi:hypothetical protein